MIPLISHHVDQLHDSPPLQLLEAGAHIGTGDPQRLDDFLRVQRARRKEKQRVNLGHASIDAPARPHLPPMEDELLLDWTEFRHILLFLSIQKLLNKPSFVNWF